MYRKKPRPLFAALALALCLGTPLALGRPSQENAAREDAAEEPAVDPAPEGARAALARARLEEGLVRSERTAVLLGELMEARLAWRSGQRR